MTGHFTLQKDLQWQGQGPNTLPMESTAKLSDHAPGDRSFPESDPGTESNRKRRDGQGRHLYFIKIAKGRGPVKIGRANDPLIRLATLQVASPYGLRLLGVLHGCGPDEAEFHYIVRESRVRGEWFSWTKHVEETVKLALAGGNWRSEVGTERHVSAHGEWFSGSPLYSPHVKTGAVL